MGCCSCKQKTDDDGEMKSKAPKGKKNAWEKDLMEKTIMSAGHFKKAVIVSFPGGDIMASAPADFKPSKQGIKDIVSAFKGDTEAIAEKGLDLGGGMKKSVPGKMDKDKAIYGNDGEQGGCSAFRSKKAVLIVVFESPTNPDVAHRLAEESADHMAENDH